jgi:Cu-processing system ATP-binding protein
MTGIETLSFYARLKRQPMRVVSPLLERVGLAGAGGRRVGTYSKGMRQRLGIAQALLGAPRALLLDEPTSGLDPAARRDLYAVMRELRDAGTCVLISSHALAELEGLADRVVLMNQGRKIADGTLTELRAMTAVRPRLRWRLACGRIVDTACDETALAAALRDLPCGATEIEILRPGLDDICAALLQREDGSQCARR